MYSSCLVWFLVSDRSLLTLCVTSLVLSHVISASSSFFFFSKHMTGTYRHTSFSSCCGDWWTLPVLLLSLGWYHERYVPVTLKHVYSGSYPLSSRTHSQYAHTKHPFNNTFFTLLHLYFSKVCNHTTQCHPEEDPLCSLGPLKISSSSCSKSTSGFFFFCLVK